jgi:tetratricopeptide (TPR) repeat protein
MRRAPRTNDVEWRQYYDLLWTHPEQYLRIADDTIRQYPEDPQGYRDCITYWMHFEQYDCALCDIDQALALGASTMTRVERGAVLRCLGRYREAIEELNRCEAKAPGMYSPLIEINRAACHARLGNLTAALADCARLPDDHCMPGFDGALGGTKSQIIEEARRLAAAAQNRNM